MRAEFGDLTECWLLDNGHGIEVLTRDEKILHAIVLTDQLLALRALSNERPN